MDHFPYIHLCVTLTCKKSGRLNIHKTSMLRGIIGRQLKHQVCHDFQLPCEECEFSNNCIYPALFESPDRLTNKLGRGGTVPHPYIIRCHNHKEFFDQGDLLEFEMILIGKSSMNFTTYLLHVFEKLEVYPFGKDKITFAVRDVVQLEENEKKTIMDDSMIQKPTDTLFSVKSPNYNKLLVQFITPFRMMRKGKVLGSITLHDFLWQVNHRFQQLSVLNNYTESIEQPTLVMPHEESMKLIQSEWGEIVRYSFRQNQAIKLSGIKATFELTRTEELDQWIPLILFGEQFHIGKATTFGLGQYELWFK